MYQNEKTSKQDYSDKASLEGKLPRPVFAELLDQLTTEVQCANGLSSQVMQYCNTLQPIALADSDSEARPEDKKDPSGIIGLLFLEVRKLRAINNVFSNCAEHLKNVIGS